MKKCVKNKAECKLIQKPVGSRGRLRDERTVLIRSGCFQIAFPAGSKVGAACKHKYCRLSHRTADNV